MTQSKTKVVGFRLSAELLAEAEKTAAQEGDKNVAAWCQRIIVEILSGGSQDRSKPMADWEDSGGQKILLGIENLRQMNFEYFELFFKDDPRYEEFLKASINSQKSWEEIIGKKVPAESPAQKTVEFKEFELLIEEIDGELIDLFGDEKLIAVPPREGHQDSSEEVNNCLQPTELVRRLENDFAAKIC